jgi:CheY-like chemotaxis protein
MRSRFRHGVAPERSAHGWPMRSASHDSAAPETRRADLTWGPRPPVGHDTGSASRWVLTADDDDLTRGIWTEVLTTAGYRAIEARSGEAALDLMGAVVPDLLILDLHLPGLSGAEVLQHLRQSPVLRDLPVLIVSGFLDTEPQDGFGLNIVGRLPKPVSVSLFLESVTRALAHRPEPQAAGVSLPALET